ADTSLLKIFGQVIGVTGIPSLNNTGDRLAISNAKSNIIDELNYDDSWYNDNAKKTNGWSLELINPNYPCALTADNWSASNAAEGGTPGKQNSIWNTTP